MRSRFDRFAIIAVISLGVAISACAKPTGGPSVHTDPNVITQQTLATNHFLNAYDAVQSLRSNWLSAKGTDSFQTPTEVRVYLNNTMLGGVQTLREIGTPTVTYIRHYDGIAATARWGLGHGAGVIYVSTRPDSADQNGRVTTFPPPHN